VITLVKTTINAPDDLWRRFLAAVIKERGGRKANEVIIELITKYLQDKKKDA